MLIEKFFAEIIGTFIFLSVIITSGHATSRCADQFAWLKIGFTLSVVILLIGTVSGSHVNPAVSFMLYLNNDIDITTLFVYIIAQIIGSVLAYFYYIFLSSNFKNLFVKNK